MRSPCHIQALSKSGTSFSSFWKDILTKIPPNYHCKPKPVIKNHLLTKQGILVAIIFVTYFYVYFAIFQASLSSTVLWVVSHLPPFKTAHNYFHVPPSVFCMITLSYVTILTCVSGWSQKRLRSIERSLPGWPPWPPRPQKIANREI